MSNVARILTQERVAEINARINQRSLKTFFKELVGDNTRRTSHIIYDSIDDRFDKVQVLLENLSKAKDIQYIESRQENWDPKRHGGAGSLSSTRRAYVRILNPPFIDTNVTVWGIDVVSLKMLFFPDILLIYQNGQYKTMSYDSLSVNYDTTRFAGASHPSDTEVVGRTWRYVNVNGGPDRRFKDNHPLNIALYGLVNISATSGLSVPLRISDRALAANFAEASRGILHPMRASRGATNDNRGKKDDRRTKNEKRSSNSKSQGPRGPDEPIRKPARDILGVPPNATKSEINAAYRRMAQMYHPDKVANLAPEFKDLAERRMKEINAAYAELSKTASR